MHAQPHALPEEEDIAVVPGDDSNDDPTPPLPVDPAGTPERNPAVDSAVRGAATPVEPEMGNARVISSDGRYLYQPATPVSQKPERE